MNDFSRLLAGGCGVTDVALIPCDSSKITKFLLNNSHLLNSLILLNVVKLLGKSTYFAFVLSS